MNARGMLNRWPGRSFHGDAAVVLRTLLPVAVMLVPASPLEAQLMRWTVRGVDGVRLMDLGTPVPTVGPLIAGFGTGGEEDVNIMTDASGNLLFCTAVATTGEIQVRDANLAPMPNGFGLIGHSSSLQSAICPIPCHPDRYYYIHLLTGPAGNLYYSTIDMALNGGLGDVVLKNQPIGSGFTEGLAISHQLPNGCRWLFSSVRNGPAYDVVRCLISQSGIGPPTVIASVAPNGPVYNFNEIELSPDNTRLAMSVYTTDPLEPDIVMWDLDLPSGTLTNQQSFAVSSDPIIGIQFSPLGQYIYFVGNGVIDAMDFGRVNVGTGAVDIIDPNMGRYLTMTELGGNGRVYVAMNYNHTTMAEVDFPDAPSVAAIGYDHNAVFISPSGCRPPLPNAIEGEPPGSTTTPGYIAFTALPVGGCDTYQFVDSTCLATWWEWDLGDGTVTNDPAPVHQYAAGVYDVTLRVVACGDTLVLTKPAYITATTTPPTAEIAAPAQACAGEPVVLSNTGAGPAASTWDLGDGTTASGTVVTHAYTQAGVYTIELVASGSCASDTATAQVVVIANIEPSFTVDGDPCTGTFTFQNTSATGSVWWWDFGDGSGSAAASPSHSYTAPGSYLVVLTGDPGSPCAGTAATTVEVPTLPEASFTASTGCSTVVEVVVGGTPGMAMAWSWGDGSTAPPVDGTHAYAQPGTYTIVLIVQNTAGCTDTAAVSVQVPVPVVAAFSHTSDPCTGTVAFQNNSTGAVAFAWDLGDGNSTTANSPRHTYVNDGEYPITLIATGANGCSDTTTAVIGIVAGALSGQWFVPNVFTPNGDGINDIFLAVGPAECGVPVLSILNRWGELLFEAPATKAWDGRYNGEPVPGGTYVYVLKGTRMAVHGHVTVLR